MKTGPQEPSPPTPAEEENIDTTSECIKTFGNNFIEIKQDNTLFCDEDDKELCCARNVLETHMDRIRDAAASLNKQIEIFGPARTPGEQSMAYLDYLAGGNEACGPIIFTN